MQPKTSAGLPLVAYADTLTAQARVLVVGDARSLLPAALVERGARLVHVCDSDATRLAEAQARSSDRAITFGRLDDGPAALREAFFDLVLVENLAREADPGRTLNALARLLAPRGLALIAAPNPEATRPLLAMAASPNALDYYALYDAATAVFPQVRMLGQVPFVGYALVDFSAEGDPSPVLDASLLPPRGEEPDYFVALAARQRRTLEQYAVVQLPLADVMATKEPAAALATPAVAAPALAAPKIVDKAPVVAKSAAPSAAIAAAAALEQKLKKQELWIAELEARASTADERADEADERAETAEARASSAEVRNGELESQAKELEKRFNSAEKVAAELTVRLTEVEREHRRDQAKFAEERNAQRAELESLRTRVAELDALRARVNELDALRTRTSELEALLRTREAELAAQSEEGEAGLELSALENQLKERGERVALLERSLAEAERVGRELVRKLRDAALPSKAVELSTQLAEAEAEIATLRWSLALSTAQKGAHTLPQ